MKHRFLRRLEQALKDRDRVITSDEFESDAMDSPKASSPLLASSNSHALKQKASNFKISRQKRVANVYSFETHGQENNSLTDFLSD